VQSCELDGSNQWVIKSIRDGVEKTELFSHLVVCNGHHWQPRLPQYPGNFTGKFMHSHEFKHAKPFTDQRVLVIGGGNSACDVAVETSRVSKKTSISWRRGYRIVPKFLFGKPSDVVASRMAFLPTRLKFFLSELTVKIFSGANKNYGLPEPEHAITGTHPTINEELLYKLRHGKVFPKGDIDHLDGEMVHFKDGSSEAFDTIIACTGYILEHPFFRKDFLNYSEGDVPLYLKMLHEKYDNLFFVGMFQPLGCIWPAAELQAKIAARAIKGLWKRPENIAALCQREVTHPNLNQIKTPRHTITVDFHLFTKQLKKHLPQNYVSKLPA
jgi:hypothetical protein